MEQYNIVDLPTEILLEILAHIHPKSIVRIRRVCKTFKIAIDSTYRSNATFHQIYSTPLYINITLKPPSAQDLTKILDISPDNYKSIIYAMIQYGINTKEPGDCKHRCYITGVDVQKFLQIITGTLRYSIHIMVTCGCTRMGHISLHSIDGSSTAHIILDIGHDGKHRAIQKFFQSFNM